MRNIAQFESFLGKGMNEGLKPQSENFVKDMAAKMGVDPEQLLRMVQSDLEEEGVSESKIYEFMGSDGLITMTDFFILFPSVIAGLVTLALGGTWLEGWRTNKQWIKAEAEQKVKEMIKKDPNLIDRQEELTAKVAEELKNDPKVQDMLKKAKWEGGKQHPSIKKDRSYARSHIFGGGY
jgi:hypothetical protein